MLNLVINRYAIITRKQLIQKSTLNNLVQKRFSGPKYWGYREINYEENRKFTSKATSVLGGLAYWWVLWHFWHEYKHLIGEFIWPEFDEWSDEELGIPPEED